MNEEQRKLAEQNIGVVFFTLNKYFPGSTKDEDLVSVGYEGLCIAAKGYDPSKGKFSTYAAKCIRFCVMTEIRSRKKHSKNIYMSNMSAMVEEATYDGHYGAEDEGFDDVDSEDQFIQFQHILSDMEREIMNLSKSGLSALDIAKELGLSRGKVYTVIREIKALWKIYRRNE